MKKITTISLILFSLLCSSAAKAQLKFGGEIAITTSSVKITDIKDEFTDAVKGNNIIGYEGGIFLRVSIGPLYVKPKLLLDYQSGTLFYTSHGVEQSVNFHGGKVLIPVLVGFKFLPVLSLEAGPVYNHFLFATKDFNGNHLDLEQGGLGYRIGLNAELGILNLTVSYQGIKNSGSATSAASYQSPDQLIFGLGIEF
jgi:hypothetical protein